MTIRAEIVDGKIELMRPHTRAERNVFHKNLDLERAMILIRFYLQRDLESSNKSKFVSQSTKDARKAFKTLNNRSPYAKR